MNKKIFFPILVILIVILNISISYANCEYVNISTKYKALVEDDAKLLTDLEEERLLNQMKPLTEFGHIVYKSIIDDHFDSSESFSENYYYSNFGNESGTQLLVDMNKRYLIITSAGENYKVVTKSKSNTITDNIYKYASNGKYYSCASNAFKQVSKLLNGGKIPEPMKYINNALLALLISLVITFLFIKKVSSINKIKNKEILKNINHFIKINDINIKLIHTRSVYSPVSSSLDGGSSSGGSGFSGGSSSSGGGHSSSGGGFSGGSGGHRF